MSRRYSPRVMGLRGAWVGVHDKVSGVNVWWNTSRWYPFAAFLAWVLNATWENAGGTPRFSAVDEQPHD